MSSSSSSSISTSCCFECLGMALLGQVVSNSVLTIIFIPSGVFKGEIKGEIREQIDAKVLEWKEEGRAK